MLMYCLSADQLLQTAKMYAAISGIRIHQPLFKEVHSCRTKQLLATHIMYQFEQCKIQAW